MTEMTSVGQDTITNPTIEILEVGYSCSPGGVDMFEVYDQEKIFDSSLIGEFKTLTEAVVFCYNLGKDFTVRTLAQWEEREAYDF